MARARAPDRSVVFGDADALNKARKQTPDERHALSRAHTHARTPTRSLACASSQRVRRAAQEHIVKLISKDFTTAVLLQLKAAVDLPWSVQVVRCACLRCGA